jgi:hypothetical protein
MSSQGIWIILYEKNCVLETEMQDGFKPGNLLIKHSCLETQYENNNIDSTRHIYSYPNILSHK